MILSLSLLRHVGWAGLLAACGAAVACSSSSNPPPDAFIAAELGGGSECDIPSPDTAWLPVGTSTADKPTPVSDQGSTGSGTATIDCTVHPSGSGFDISLSVSVAGTPGGNITITSPAGTGAVTTSGGKGITASFFSNNRGPYAETDCTISYRYMGAAVPDNPPIAAGRIWGHIVCPNAKESGQTTTGPDGGAVARQCPASADFLFEQCNQ
jgi:hypothetical protein